MRSYTFNEKIKRYAVPAPDRVGYQFRSTRLAAGMLATSNRSAHSRRLSPEALALVVNGTTDECGRVFQFWRENSNRQCPCCRQTVKAYVLSDRGQRRLKQLRRKYNTDREA